MVYIQSHGSATCAELSLAFKMTRANMHYHLSILEEGHLITRIPDTKSLTVHRGRKNHRYILSSTTQPDNYLHLAQGLLEFLSTSCQLELETNLRSLASVLFPPFLPVSSTIIRLNAAVIRLNEHNYNASWEAGKAGPCFYFHNCPYRGMLPDFPQLCIMDEYILENLTGYRLSQTRKADLITDSNLCEFSL